MDPSLEVPLTDLTPKEKTEVDKLEAETDEIRINSSVLDPAEVRKSVAGDPDSRYQGIDPDDDPDLLEEEKEPKGAAAGLAKAEEADPGHDEDTESEPQREAQ